MEDCMEGDLMETKMDSLAVETEVAEVAEVAEAISEEEEGNEVDLERVLAANTREVHLILCQQMEDGALIRLWEAADIGVVEELVGVGRAMENKHSCSDLHIDSFVVSEKLESIHTC
jgi:hypothetical protein